MPTYEYKCDKCGRTMEAFQSIKDKPLRKCPECGKNGLRRLPGAGAALIFRGSGFYCTDYRKGAAASKTAAPAVESTAGSDSASSSKDTGGANKSGNGKKED